MQNKLVILFVGLLVLGAAGFFGYRQYSEKQISNDDQVMLEDVGEKKTMSGDDHVMDEGMMLAGNNSNLYEFDQAMYEKATASSDVVFLYFYANWCPICRVENPQIEAGFNELERADVVGFRVNFKDDNTSDAEAALASQFSVPYQHTKVILKEGKEIYRSGDQWDKEQFLTVVRGI